MREGKWAGELGYVPKTSFVAFPGIGYLPGSKTLFTLFAHMYVS